MENEILEGNLSNSKEENKILKENVLSLKKKNLF